MDVMNLQQRAARWHDARYPGCTAEDIVLKAMAELGEVADAILAEGRDGSHPERAEMVTAESADVVVTLLALCGRCSSGRTRRPGMGLALARMAISKYHANYIECYGPVLNKMYGTLGAADTDVYPFDRSLASADWDYDKFDDPDYHIMAVTPQQAAVAAAAEDEGLDLDEIRSQAESDPHFSENAWAAALACFGITEP